MRVRDLSIKWKLVFIIMLVSMVALIVASTLFFTYEYKAVQALMERDLETISHISAANSTAAISFDDPTAANDTLNALAAKPAIEVACIYDKDGRVFACYFRNGQKVAVSERPGIDGFERFGDRLALYGPITLKNERIGTIYVRSDYSQLHESLTAYAAASAGILLMTALFAFVLSSLLQRPFLAPIVGLSETARLVSEKKDYSLRGTRHGNDELGFLVDQFNLMLAQIQTRDLALEQARAELEQRVDARTRELQQANKELEAFSYSVAHDLRAPLRSIDGFSQALLEDYGTTVDATGKEYLVRVRTATQRMAQLLDDMLNLARVSRSNINPEVIDLTEIANIVVAELRRQYPSREVEFIVGSKLSAKGDPGLMRIVLDNLLGNAWKFTEKQTPAKIELGRIHLQGKDAYFVRDNGAGFDMAYADKLFGVFQRLHTASEFQGTGVGLATVQRIVQRHDGKIWAEAAVDKGATFFFTLRS